MWIDYALYLAYACTGIAAAAMLIFPLVYLVKYPQEATKTLIALVAIIIVFSLGYMLSSDEIVLDASGKVIADSGTSQFASTGLISFYILAGIASILLIYSEISILFK